MIDLSYLAGWFLTLSAPVAIWLLVYDAARRGPGKAATLVAGTFVGLSVLGWTLEHFEINPETVEAFIERQAAVTPPLP